MLNVASFVGQVISAPQKLEGYYNQHEKNEIVFEIACQRDSKQRDQNIIIDLITCVCRGDLSFQASTLQPNSFISVQGRIETGLAFRKPYLVLDIKKLNQL